MGPRIGRPEPGLNYAVRGVEVKHEIMRTVGVGVACNARAWMIGRVAFPS
jgi:hypothetical protein